MAVVFDEVQFPPSISAGAVGGPQFSTDVVITSSGIEKRNSNWSASRMKWDVSTGVKKKADSDAVIAFFRARNGKARGFRFKDWTDYAATAQAMSPGTAVKLTSTDVTAAAPDKSYTTAGAISFSNLLAGDSVYVSGFANGGNNGTKTVVSATATKLIVSQTVTDEAAGASVTFLKLGPYQLQKLYTSGGQTYTRTIQKPVAGTVVVYFAGVAQPTWWTVDTTTGIVTLVGGTAAPANAAAITADCQFDTPARFDTDDLPGVIIDPGDSNGPYVNFQKVPIVEIRLQ